MKTDSSVVRLTKGLQRLIAPVGMVMYAYEVETKQKEKLPDIKKKSSPYMFWYSGTKHWIHDLWE